jgi:hypothetical protein
MDADTFDRFTVNALSNATRRTAFGLLLGGIFGLTEFASGTAKKHKNKRKKHRGGSPPVSPPPSPPSSPPPLDLCANGVKDGDEADVDCGGSCLPCANGQTCTTGADCWSRNCAANGTCQPCNAPGAPSCGSDQAGLCGCSNFDGFCYSSTRPTSVANCSECPPTASCFEFEDGPHCRLRCDANLEA